MHIKKIEFKRFYFILFNLFRLKPIKTDFVLTTLATRCQTSDNNWRKRRIRNQCHFWSRVATYLIDPSKQSQHDSARVGTRNAKVGPNMNPRKGFIPAIIGLTSRWRLAVRAKEPLAEDDMSERWNWNYSTQQLTTQDSGIQHATKCRLSHWRETQEKKEKKRKPKQNTKREETKSHRFAICTQSPLCNSCLENGSQKSCRSDL